MRNLKLTVAYDGTEFHGWQIQPGLPTIQGALQEALQRLLNHQVSVAGSGRTDAGVHAYGQVANVHTTRTMEASVVLRGLNALLPAQIRVLTVDEVGADFHARVSARSKTYEYRVWRQSIGSPFHYRYVYAFTQTMDTAALDDATRCFPGTYDFTSFCAASSEIENRVRTIHSAVWERHDQLWVFRICGNGFLQYMVRTIVGTLLHVGTGKLAAAQIPAILEARDRRLAGPSAPAHGLHLMRVEY